jgi:hypothetical protein
VPVILTHPPILPAASTLGVLIQLHLEKDVCLPLLMSELSIAAIPLREEGRKEGREREGEREGGRERETERERNPE